MMTDFAFPGDGHSSHGVALEPTGNPRADRLAEMIRISAENVIEGIRRRRPTSMSGSGSSTGRTGQNSRAPRLVDVRADAQRVFALIEAWAVLTGKDGSKIGDPLRRASERTLATIARRNLGLDLTEMVGF